MITILMLPLFVFTILAGVILAGIPALLVGGICSLFLSGAWPWIVGGLFGLPIFFLLALSPEFLVESLGKSSGRACGRWPIGS